MFMFGPYSQCLCWTHIHRMFLCHTQHLTTLQTNRTVTLLIISLKSEMQWGVGALNNLQYLLESVDGYQARCERSTRYRPRPKCLGNAFKRQAVNMAILDQ